MTTKDELAAEVRELLTDAYQAPWVAVGEGDGPWMVLSMGSRNGHAPLVCQTVRKAEADLIARAPELLAGLLSRLEIAGGG